MFTKLEQSFCIKIEVARGRSTQECFHGLLEACDDTALLYRTVTRIPGKQGCRSGQFANGLRVN